jgi:ribosomal RNA assembly protein
MSGLEVISKTFQLKIPAERIGVLIGPGGHVKQRIEESTGTVIEIDSKTGDIKISLKEGADPSMLLKARDMVLAIGRGFSPERAFRLLGDDIFLEIIDLRSIVGRSQSELRRIKGRLIGKKGKAWKIIEETTGALLSVYGHTVSIIGDFEAHRIVRQAISMLLQGYSHGAVFRFLYQRRREIKGLRLKEKIELWERKT